MERERRRRDWSAKTASQRKFLHTRARMHAQNYYLPTYLYKKLSFVTLTNTLAVCLIYIFSVCGYYYGARAIIF